MLLSSSLARSVSVYEIQDDRIRLDFKAGKTVFDDGEEISNDARESESIL